MSSTPRQATQVQTLAPQGNNSRWLGTLGNVNGLIYGNSRPGGDDVLSCTLAVEPQYRTDALNPGRLVRAWRGASCIWNGILDEPVGGSSGWSITAHGSGTFGSTYMAETTSWDQNSPVNAAIGEGLAWINPGISGAWLTPTAPDNYSEYITDFLNNMTIQAGLIWYVAGTENALQIGVFPTVVDRLLISTVPVARTITGDINWLWYKYTSSNDGSGNAVYTFGSVSNAAAIAQHGRLENTIDMSGVGVMSAAQAQANAQCVLNQYQRANFAGPFTCRYGQVLTPGGSPIDLGTEKAGHVYRLIATDAGYGGEFVAGPITFMSGNVSYDDDAQQLTVTPYQSYQTDLATLLTALVPALRQ